MKPSSALKRSNSALSTPTYKSTESFSGLSFRDFDKRNMIMLSWAGTEITKREWRKCHHKSRVQAPVLYIGGKIRIDETKAQDFLGEISIFGCMKHVSTGPTLPILIYLRTTYSKTGQHGRCLTGMMPSPSHELFCTKGRPKTTSLHRARWAMQSTECVGATDESWL